MSFVNIILRSVSVDLLKNGLRQQTLDKNHPSAVFFSKESHQHWAPEREWIPAALVTRRNVYQLTPVKYILSIWRHNRAHDLSSGPHTLNESVEKHLFIHPSPPSQVSLKRLTGVFSASFSLLSSGQSRSCFNIDAIHGKRKTDCDFDEICAFF